MTSTSWRQGSVILFATLVLFINVFAASAGDTEYVTGGALAGVKLPLFPTHQGEPEGFPGSVRQPNWDFAYTNNIKFEPATHPQLELYPGSVENFRYYWMHYVPARSFFDRQSLIRTVPAAEAAGLGPDAVEPYAAPLYYVGSHQYVHTGRFNAPVPVVRAGEQSPAFQLDCGELQPGLYAVRVIGAVEPEKIVQHRLPLYMRLTVNDGLDGSEHIYRLRCGYVDEFYAVAEFYFHAPEARAYRASVAVDRGSMVDLLVHNIELHDVLAGTTRRAVKTRSTLGRWETPPTTAAATLSAEARRTRDEEIWMAVPPLNSHIGIIFGDPAAPDNPNAGPMLGANGQSQKEIEDQHGKWMPRGSDKLPQGADARVLMENWKLGLAYTMEDLAAYRPLPDPYPFKDEGAGLFTPATSPDQPGQNWFPIAEAVRSQWNRLMGNRRIGVPGAITTLTEKYRKDGDPDAGRDAAMLLVRIAYQYPTLDSGQAMSSIAVIPGGWNRDHRFRQRLDGFDFWRDMTEFPVHAYDALFDLIKDNQELADAVNRFVPWVKTPADVIQLIDVYLVQTYAKRLLRHQYQHAEPQPILLPATVLVDHEVTGPWMEWLYNCSFTYPNELSGIQDMAVIGYCRDGHSFIGSTSYAVPAFRMAEAVERYIRAGGDPRYSLMDATRYPKVVESFRFGNRLQTAGLYYPSMGSVTGPDKGYGAQFKRITESARWGWEKTGEPEFAFALKHFVGRDKETDAAWQAIEKAAEGRRAPWLENRSRVLPNYAAILEGGVEHDDFRFRRSAILRIGGGYGHAHSDTLDLQLYAHGLPMTADGGQRNGYSNPSDTSPRVHNKVLIDGGDGQDQVHAWVRSMADAEGARYMQAEAAHGTLYRRQVALIDVDAGSGSVPLTPEQLAPKSALPADVVTPNTYLFDVVRVAGGKRHAYAFHANISDPVETNMKNATPADQAAADERDLLDNMVGDLLAGDASDHLIATFPMARDSKWGQESRNLAPMWTPEQPRAYTRLHLLGEEGSRVMTGDSHCYALDYRMPHVFVQRRDIAEGSAFMAVIEPYKGEPFITALARVDIEGNETDAQRAVAVRLKTVNGHQDLCFADGRPEKERVVAGVKVAGEFAYLSRDADGLRQATLVGGTLLDGAGVTLRVAAREHTGTIIGVDYRKKAFQIDQPWPTLAGRDRIFEVGRPGSMTQFTAVKVTADGTGARVTALRSADQYLSRVESVQEDGVVMARVGMGSPRKELHLSNEDGTKTWRGDYLGSNRFKLTSGNVSAEDFGENGGLYVWDYGIGDTVRQPTQVNLRRTAPGVYTLTADSEVEITLAASKPRTVTRDELVAGGGTVTITADQ